MSKVAESKFFDLVTDVAGSLRAFEEPRATVAYWKKLRLYDQTEDVYRSLGGQQKYIPFPYQHNQLIAGEHLVMLDTSLAYNRYRIKTFRNPVYDNLPGVAVDSLRRFCRQYESECLKSGMREGIWTSEEAESHFGAASEPGDFHGNGAPGWKWHAYTDHIMDIMSLYSGVPVIRFSIYDNLMVDGKIVQVQDLMMTSSDERYPDFIKNYISRKLKKVGV
ncbi:hypothetical protein AB9P05_20665 [Roseivirga sp. BDSF3-8]|uniref:DUF7255 family protein n=1 Tax=Roseivirga sp. BDSF3-8 TaxID=3241598 RepID=UPI003531CDAE